MDKINTGAGVRNKNTMKSMEEALMAIYVGISAAMDAFLFDGHG